MTDLETIFRWENDSQLHVVSDYRHPVSMFSIEQYIINSNHDPFINGQLRLMAQTIEPPELIGHVDLFDVDPVHRRAAIGIMIEEEKRGMGYAIQILELIEKYCINTLGIHQMWCQIVLPNAASIKLFEKYGFSQGGVKTDWIQKNGRWHDVAFYQKILKT
jgi:diamine N-acetyltransferase